MESRSCQILQVGDTTTQSRSEDMSYQVVRPRKVPEDWYTSYYFTTFIQKLRMRQVLMPSTDSMKSLDAGCKLVYLLYLLKVKI